MQAKRRKVLLCDFCRKRKIKCSKEVPCTTCVKRNGSCTYSYIRESTSPGDSNNSDDPFGLLDLNKKQRSGSPEEDKELLHTLSILNEKITSLEDTLKKEKAYSEDQFESDDEINFYDYRGPSTDKIPHRRATYGVLSWTSLLYNDPVLKQVWTNDLDGRPDNLVEQPLSGEGLKNLKMFNDSFVATNKHPANAQSRPKFWHKIRTLLELTSYSSNRDGKELSREIVSQIRDILPNHRVLWYLIDLYFSKIFSMFPFVNEYVMRSKLESLLGGRSDDMIPVLQIALSNRNDFAYLGMLLVILRLTFIHIYSGDMINTDVPDIDSIYQELNNTFDACTNLQYILLAHLCLDQFNLLVAVDLPVLQLLIFLRYYYISGPEFGDNSDEGHSQNYNAAITQIAFSLGLHKDPNTGSDSEDNLRRMLWIMIGVLDLNSFLLTGEPPTFGKYYYNTRVPQEGGESNTINSAVEATAFKFLANTRVAFRWKQDFHYILNSNKPFSLKQTAAYLETHFGGPMVDFVPMFNHLMLPSSDDLTMVLGRSFNFKFFLLTSSMIIALNYHFYLHLCNLGKPQKAIQYIYRIIRVICEIVLPVLNKAFLYPENHGSYFKVSIIPSLLLLLGRVVIISLGLVLRLKVIDLESTALRLNLMKLIQLSVEFVKSFFSDYYFSWRLMKMLQKIAGRVQLRKLKHLAKDNFGFTSNSIDMMSQSLHNALMEFDISLAFADLNGKYSTGHKPGVIVDLNGLFSIPDDVETHWMLVLAMKHNDPVYSKFDLAQEFA